MSDWDMSKGISAEAHFWPKGEPQDPGSVITRLTAEVARLKGELRQEQNSRRGWQQTVSDIEEELQQSERMRLLSYCTLANPSPSPCCRVHELERRAEKAEGELQAAQEQIVVLYAAIETRGLPSGEALLRRIIANPPAAVTAFREKQEASRTALEALARCMVLREFGDGTWVIGVPDQRAARAALSLPAVREVLRDEEANDG